MRINRLLLYFLDVIDMSPSGFDFVGKRGTSIPLSRSTAYLPFHLEIAYLRVGQVPVYCVKCTLYSFLLQALLPLLFFPYLAGKSQLLEGGSESGRNAGRTRSRSY